MELIAVKISADTHQKLKKAAAERKEFIYQTVERLAEQELQQIAKERAESKEQPC